MAQQVQGVSALIDGNPQGFMAALRRAEGAAKDSSQRIGGIFSSIGDVFGSVQAKLAAFVGALGGGALFGKAIANTAEFTRSSMELGRALGTSAAEASTWIATLRDLDIGTDEFAGASRGLLTNLRNNEEQLRAYGLATRDANGQLRPFNELLMDAIEVVNGYAEGTDRNIAAQAIFGRSVNGSSRILQMNRQATAELTEYQKQLGLVVGQKNVAAYEAYDGAMDKVDLGMQGISQVIADTLMPVLTQLGNEFADSLPKAIATIRDAIGPLIAKFVTLGFTIEAAMKMAVAGFKNFEIATNASEEIKAKLGSLDLSGAMAAWDKGNAALLKNSSDALQAFRDRLDDTRRLVDRLYAGTVDAYKIDPSQKSLDALIAKVTGGKRAPDGSSGSSGNSIMSQLQTQLEQRKLAWESENQAREFSKSQELAYWKEVLRTVDLSQKDREAILLRGAKLEVEILRDAAKQKQAIDGIRAESALAATMAEIDAAERAAEAEVTTGTRTKASLLALQRQFNEERLVIELEYLDRKRALLATDPDRNLVALEQLEATKLEIKRKYADLGLEISNKEAAETGSKITNISQTIGQAFSTFANSFLTNWRGLANALRSLLSSIGQSIINELVLKPLQAKIAGFARDRMLALATIGTEAAKAGAGAASSQAAIPIVGPGLAIAAMASIVAAVGGMAGKVPSAAKGFDIPRGLNPLTQLHEREMVLPASLADTVRDMAAARVAGESPQVRQPIQLRAAKAGDFFMINRNELADVLRVLGAEFKLRP